MDIYFTKWSESCWENCWMKSCWCKSRARNRSSAPKELAAKLCLSRLSHDKDRQTFNNVQQCSTCSTIVVITSSKHPDWRTYSLDLPPSTPIGATLCAVAPTRRWPFPEAAHMAIPGHRLLPWSQHLQLLHQQPEALVTQTIQIKVHPPPLLSKARANWSRHASRAWWKWLSPQLNQLVEVNVTKLHRLKRQLMKWVAQSTRWGQTSPEVWTVATSSLTKLATWVWLNLTQLFYGKEHDLPFESGLWNGVSLPFLDKPTSFMKSSNWGFFVPELCTSYPVADPVGLTPRILSHLELGGLGLSTLVQKPFLGLPGLSFTKKISKPR